jgi:hypothetical protein
MNEIIKDYIHHTSCKIIVNKLQKVLTYIICQQMDEMPHWHFIRHIGISFATLAFHLPHWNVCGNLMWRLVTKKLHIVVFKLHHIYNIIYNIGCLLQLLQLVR